MRPSFGIFGKYSNHCRNKRCIFIECGTQSSGLFKALYTSPLTFMFIPTPFRLVWEAYSHAAITARRLCVQIPMSVCSHVLIYTAERTVATWDERIYQSFETAATGFEPEFSRLRACRCNPTAPHNDQGTSGTFVKRPQNKSFLIHLISSLESFFASLQSGSDPCSTSVLQS